MSKEQIIEQILGHYQRGWQYYETRELCEQMRDLELDHLKIHPKEAKQLKREELLARLSEQDKFNLGQMSMEELNEELRFQNMGC